MRELIGKGHKTVGLAQSKTENRWFAPSPPPFPQRARYVPGVQCFPEPSPFPSLPSIASSSTSRSKAPSKRSNLERLLNKLLLILFITLGFLVLFSAIANGIWTVWPFLLFALPPFETKS